MKTFITRIIIILFFVVALPLIFFLVKQASNLSENEEIVQRVFDKQLETILYTINQNSENVIVSWVSQIDLPVDYNGEVMQKITSNIFANNIAVEQIQFINLSEKKTIASYSQNNIEKTIIHWPGTQLVNKLGELIKNKFQKIEAVRDSGTVNLFFILKASNNDVLAAFSIRSDTFIDQNLRPGIQQISQDRFNISILDSGEASTNLLSDSLSITPANIHEQEMWYLPGYKISIGLKSATIDQLVSARMKRDNYIFAGMILLIVLGISFVIYSIRKEIKLAELKSEFVSNVSHEIRTPLALISMYTETLLLNRVKTEEKKTEYLNIIHLEANRLASMVSRILSFSKMEKGKRNYHFTNVDLNELIKNVVTHFQPHFDAEKVECKLEFIEAECFINADKEAITEALINLIENAIKYGNDDSKMVVIRTKTINGNVAIEVEDNGIGIAPKHQKYIFDKFYRVTQGNLAHKAKGSGIGLNIVKQIMIQHEGKVTVNSHEGEGSCFSLIFNEKCNKNG